MNPNQEIKGGRYVLLRALGEGSQGETWEALDRGPHFRRAPSEKRDLAAEWQRYVRASKGEVEPPGMPGSVVAIKMFRVGKAKVWKDVELAEREARTLSTLSHPKLPRYHEHFEEGGTLFLVMEKIEGQALSTKRSLAPADVMRMLEDCGSALAYLRSHSPVIVHRDIKPGNIIRRPDGSFAIVDFGSVRDHLKPAGGSTVVGTFGYMAPEQFQGRASPRSDVFGLAATALAMLTGTEPENLPHQGLAIDVARAVPHGTPPELLRALAKMLVPDPDLRVDSVEEALQAGRSRDDSKPKERFQAQRRRGEDPRDRHLRKREEHRQKREERRALRKERRARRWPLLLVLLAHLALFVAWLGVWVVVGIALPILLLLLSALFGGVMGRAAAACVRAAKGAQRGLGRASARVRGAPPTVRVDGGALPPPSVASRIATADALAEEEAAVLQGLDERHDDEHEERSRT